MKNFIPANTILSTAVFCLITFSTVNAQPVACEETVSVIENEPKRSLSVITERDYPNLMNLSGLQQYSNVRYDVKLNKNNEYRLDGRGKNASLNAIYGKDGNLITATYITKNSKLPHNIYHQLMADQYKDWTMTANKKTVTDFDIMNTEYEVKIQKGKLEQTLYFDYSGNQVTQLASSKAQ